jgi:hypothetical protein
MAPRLGLTVVARPRSDTKKDLQAAEQKRHEAAAARHIWITRRQPFMANMLTRIGFIDETSVKTNIAKTTGRAPRGQRLVDHAPFGHGHTKSGAPPVWRGNLSTGQIPGRTSPCIAALCHDRLDAPWVIDGPINRHLFGLYIATQLAPYPAARRRDHSGQPVQPKKPQSRADAQRCRGPVPAIATLQP